MKGPFLNQLISYRRIVLIKAMDPIFLPFETGYAVCRNYRTWILMSSYGFSFGIELTADNVLAGEDSSSMTQVSTCAWYEINAQFPPRSGRITANPR